MLYKTTHNHYSLTFVSLNCSNTGLVSFLPSVSLYPITLSNSDKLTSITLKLKILLGSLVWPPTPFTTTHCFTLPNHFHQFGIYKTYHGPHLVWVFKNDGVGYVCFIRSYFICMKYYSSLRGTGHQQNRWPPRFEGWKVPRPNKKISTGLDFASVETDYFGSQCKYP